MEDSELTLSLTKSIFIQQRAGKKKKTASKSSVDGLQHQHYKNLSYAVEQQIQEIEKAAYKETLDALVKFVTEYYTLNLAGVQEIPAAILVMGVNMPDHSNIFCLLEEQLNSSGIFATVKLQSKECSSFPNLMQKLVPQVINRYQKEIKEENMSLKKTNCTFQKLLNYYENLPEPKVSRGSRKTLNKQNISALTLKSMPIVVLLQDVEAFKLDVLEELILNCNLYVKKLPIILVFGMASAMVTLHNILSQKTISCLGIETFCSLTAVEYLTKIVQEVILSSENSFKLGPKVFRLIVDSVLYHDFSVTNLTHMLKLCMFEHFYDNVFASLCCHPSEIAKILRLLPNEQIEKLKSITSFTRFLEKNPEHKASIKNRKDFMVLIEKLLLEHHTYYKLLIVLLTCLHELTKDLPGYPLGKHLREIYPLALEEQLASLPSYQQSIKLLKFLSKDQLVSKLERCMKVLSEASHVHKEVVDMKGTLNSHIQAFQNLTEVDYERETVVSNCSLNKVTSRSQLQEMLKMTLQTKRSKFENCREAVLDFLNSIFQKVNPPSELPLHDILYFDNVLTVKHHFMPAPRIALHRDLVNPQLRLKCACCKITDDKEICASMPDICALYKFHLESGKLINMFDWLQAFKSVKGNYHNGETADEDINLNIRFMHTVSELQLLGFIKPTKRKTDHVARLTFGSF